MKLLTPALAMVMWLMLPVTAKATDIVIELVSGSFTAGTFYHVNFLEGVDKDTDCDDCPGEHRWVYHINGAGSECDYISSVPEIIGWSCTHWGGQDTWECLQQQSALCWKFRSCTP